MPGIMAELAPRISLDLGCPRMQVYESADYRVALVYFMDCSRVRCSIFLARTKDSVLIELVAPSEALVRTLPLCRQHFDDWFKSPPLAVEHSNIPQRSHLWVGNEKMKSNAFKASRPDRAPSR